jgi:hypothetical protein
MRSATFLAAALFSLTVGAQELTPLSGTWEGTMTSSSTGKATRVQLTVQESSSAYRVLDRAKNNACASQDRPATVKPGRDATDVVLSVESGAIADCPAWTLSMKRIDDKTLEGTFRNGSVLHLAR